MKEEALSGEDNNEFRLGVLAAARDEMSQNSLWVGKAFLGDVTVPALVRLPWEHNETGMANIHSDFVIMIVQGGLIGYSLYAILFTSLAGLCKKAARLAHARRDSASEALFDVVQAMNVTWMLYMSQEPMLQMVQYALPCLILAPLAIFLTRAASHRHGAVERQATSRSLQTR